MAFCRGLAGKQKDVGNFYEDMVRITTRILIPVSFIAGLLLIWQGVPQTLEANQTVQTIEGQFQDLAMGPVASLKALSIWEQTAVDFSVQTLKHHLKIQPLFLI